MKVIIEDLVKHHSGGTETELPANTTIRFEVDGTKISVSLTDKGIEIYKRSPSGLDTIVIEPHSTNRIKVS